MKEGREGWVGESSDYKFLDSRSPRLARAPCYSGMRVSDVNDLISKNFSIVFREHFWIGDTRRLEIGGSPQPAGFQATDALPPRLKLSQNKLGSLASLPPAIC